MIDPVGNGRGSDGFLVVEPVEPVEFPAEYGFEAVREAGHQLIDTMHTEDSGSCGGWCSVALAAGTTAGAGKNFAGPKSMDQRVGWY